MTPRKSVSVLNRICLQTVYLKSPEIYWYKSTQFFFLRLSEFYWPCSSDNCSSWSDGISHSPHQKNGFNQCWFLNCISHISAVPACNVLQVHEYMASMNLEEERFLKGVTREIKNNTQNKLHLCHVLCILTNSNTCSWGHSCSLIWIGTENSPLAQWEPQSTVWVTNKP